MRKTWLLVGTCALLAASVSVQTAIAGSGEQKKNTDGQPSDKTAAQQLDDLTKAIKELNDTSAEAGRAFRKLTERFNALDEKLDQEVRGLRARGMTTDLNVAQVQKEVNDLKEQMMRFRQEFDSMRARSSETRISAYDASAGMAAPSARVRMVNTYMLPVMVVLNGSQFFELQPGEQRFSGPLPTGMFTYEVLGISAPRQRMLTAGETFNVTVFPR